MNKTLMGIKPERYDSFFRWVVEDDRFGGKGETKDGEQILLVHVSVDLVAEYRATVLPPDTTPKPGFYVVVDRNAYNFGRNDRAAVNAWSLGAK
jgi:hypothetical protein